MEQDDANLEEGEISDHSSDGNTYTPLERPSNYSAIVQPNQRFPSVLMQDTDSENDLIQSSDDDDSDSDLDVRKKNCKRPKVKLLKPIKRRSKEKKYDIWSTRVQEDVLAETLNSCDVTKKDRSRDVETYDYLGNHFMERTRNKRSRDDRKNSNLRLVGSKSDEKSNCKSSSRTILDLSVNSESCNEDIAKDIANKLCEEKEDLILNVVEAIGKEKTFEFFKETKKIEEDGGMLIMNQTRRRTPGGVFLFLIRHDNDLTQEQKRKIFQEEKEKYKTVLKEKQKRKTSKLKLEIAAKLSNNRKDKLLPDLLTRAELLAANENNRIRKETDCNTDVITTNPPPTPETDHHENSGDGMDLPPIRKIEAYDEDFLDLGGNSNNEMDLF